MLNDFQAVALAALLQASVAVLLPFSHLLPQLDAHGLDAPGLRVPVFAELTHWTLWVALDLVLLDVPPSVVPLAA